MIENLPLYIPFLFILITLLTVFLFYRAAGNSTGFLFFAIPWLMMQAFFGLKGFYLHEDGIPPRILMLGLPPVLLIALLILTKGGQKFSDSLDLKKLTWLHSIRLPVEIILLLLYMHGEIPKIMTFEGLNFDVLSGITAPIVAYLGFRGEKMNKRLLLIWNVIALLLLINIVSIAVLSAPTAFQKFGMTQPNVAVLFFPMLWLPCGVVPIVLYSHLVAISRLLRSN